MLWLNNTAGTSTAGAVNGSAPWPIYNGRRNSTRATHRSRPSLEELTQTCVFGRMRSGLNCELWPSIRSAHLRRDSCSSLGITRQAYLTKSGDLSVFFQRSYRVGVA